MKSRRVAVYFGSFDPVHAGHISVIRRGAALFDVLVVLVMQHPEKKAGVFSAEERLSFVRSATAALSNVRCVLKPDPGAERLADRIREHGATYVLRGVRNAADMEPEHRYALRLKSFFPEGEFVFLIDEGITSSTELKDRAARGESLEGLCTPEVAAALIARLGPSAGGT